MNDEKIQNGTSSNEVYTKEEFLKRFSKGTPTYKRESNFEKNEPKTYSLDNRKNKAYSEKTYTRNYATSYNRTRPVRSNQGYSKVNQSDSSFTKILVCAGIIGAVLIVKTVDTPSFNNFEEQLSYKLSEVVTLENYLNKGTNEETLATDLEPIENNLEPVVEDLNINTEEDTIGTITELKTMTDFEVEEGLFGEKK